MTIGTWRDVAAHLDQVADSLEASSSHLAEAGALGGKVRHVYGDSEVPSFVKFASEAERKLWRAHVEDGARERGVAYAGAELLEQQLREVRGVAEIDRALPAAVVDRLSAAVGYAERMNTRRSTWVDDLQQIAAEPDARRGFRSRPAIEFENSSFLTYEWSTSGSRHGVDAVRELADTVRALDSSPDVTTVVRGHLERGRQLAFDEPLSELPADPGPREGVERALRLRERATPVVATILQQSDRSEGALTTATRDSLLATATRRIEQSIGTRLGTEEPYQSAHDALDAVRDVAALAGHSRELADGLGPALEVAERGAITAMMRPVVPNPPLSAIDGHNMFGIRPMATVEGLDADALPHIGHVRAALRRLDGGAPELRAAIDEAADQPARALSFADEFTARLAASRAAVAIPE